MPEARHLDRLSLKAGGAGAKEAYGFEGPVISGQPIGDVGASQTCDCRGTGATGASCEVDIDECASEPCEHGTCVNGKNEYTCNRRGSPYAPASIVVVP